MTDIDMELKRLFDQRLGALTPPSTSRRPAPRRLGLAAAAVTVTLALAGGALVFDVNSVAAANGADCASFLTKVQVWAQSHRNDLVGTDHAAAKAKLAKLVAESGCPRHDATHDARRIGPHH